METASNYDKIISAITLFDNIVSGNVTVEHKSISETDMKQYAKILQHLLYDAEKNIFHPFIYSTFESFARSKNNIVIDYYDTHQRIDSEEMMNVI